jgi:hypothetical protein
MAEPHGLHGDPLWYITLTVYGPITDLAEVALAMDRLAHEHPFLLSGRYARNRAELRYWEEAPDLLTAGRLALHLWEEHRESAGLPPWRPAGLEVLDRDLYHHRFAHGWGPRPMVRAGDIRPF